MELARLEPEGQVKGASCKGGNHFGSFSLAGRRGRRLDPTGRQGTCSGRGGGVLSDQSTQNGGRHDLTHACGL